MDFKMSKTGRIVFNFVVFSIFIVLISSLSFLIYRMSIIEKEKLELKKQIDITSFQLNELKSKVQERTKDLVLVQEKLQKRDGFLGDIEEQLKEKNDYITSLLNQFKEDQNKFAQLIEELQEEKRKSFEITEKLKRNNRITKQQLEDERKSLEEKLAQVEKDKNDVEKELVALNDKISFIFSDDLARKIDRFSIEDATKLSTIKVTSDSLKEGRVVSIDQSNNIIAFDMGFIDGVEEDDVVNIFNGEHLIARAKVYKVESNVSTADILAEYKGSDIQLNDVVRVFIEGGVY